MLVPGLEPTRRAEPGEGCLAVGGVQKVVVGRKFACQSYVCFILKQDSLHSLEFNPKQGGIGLRQLMSGSKLRLFYVRRYTQGLD